MTSMSTNFQPFIDFHSWADGNQVIGTDCLGPGNDGLGNGARYIPFDALEEYWQDNRISHILNICSDETPIHVSIDDILTRYLRVFSILVYISTSESVKLNYITRFIERDIDDKLLPFKSQPDAFPNAADGTQTFEQFQKAQWLFSSIVLGPYRLRSKELPIGSILPFTVEEVLSGKPGESTIVKKCIVHPSCGLSAVSSVIIAPKGINNLSSSNRGYLQGSIVLKEFDFSELELSFKNEVDSYITLANNISPDIYSEHFLEFYGSFKKGNKAFIMLEYTGQGTLFSFFNRNELPLERHEVHGLWQSLSKLFIGLDHIHNLDHGSKNTTSGAIRCVHQDLKPTNIFVFKRGDSNSYQYQFKIGDFGMSSLALVKTRNKSIRSQDNASTKMYGAPEQTKRYAAQDDIDYGTLWEMDIWSMGCVLFEILVWMTCGSRGLLAFFQMRQEETDTDRRHRAQGYSGCFHNGTTRIQAVDNMMKLVMERRRVFDDLSSPIGDLILNEMLIPSNKRRLEARTLLPRFEKILEAETRPPDHSGSFEAQSLITPTQGGGPFQGGTIEEDRGDDGPHEHEQARTYATGRGTRDFEHQRLKSTGLRASSSLTESRHSRREWNESHPISEVVPKREISTSERTIQSPERTQFLQSSLITDSPRPISRTPVNIGLGNRISNLTLEDSEKQPAHTSIYDHRRTWISPSSDYRPDDGDSPRRSRIEESGSQAKPYAVVTINEVVNWIEKKKNGWMVEPLRDHERAMREIKDREQVCRIQERSPILCAKSEADLRRRRLGHDERTALGPGSRAGIRARISSEIS